MRQPHIVEEFGHRLFVADRSDGFSVMVAADCMTQGRLDAHLATYLDDACICDSSKPWLPCGIHRKAVCA